MEGTQGLASTPEGGTITNPLPSTMNLPNAAELIKEQKQKPVLQTKSSVHLKTHTLDFFNVRDQGKVTHCRFLVAHYLHNDWTQSFLGLTIMFNMVLVILHADAAASDTKAPDWANVMDSVLLGIYVVELVARFYVARWDFFHNMFNNLDLTVVALDVVLEIVETVSSGSGTSLSFLRVVRLARLTRAYRVMVMLPMLSGMCRDLLGAMEAILWGCVLLGMVLTVFSIITVQMIHPLVQDLVDQGKFEGCERCPRAWSTVMSSNLTYIQHIIAGDSWGQATIPIIEAHPWTACLFIPVLVTISLAIMNVILAVIVESAEQTRREDLVEKMKMKEAIFLKKSRDLNRVCGLIDQDMSGDLSLEELLEGFETQPELGLILADMGIDKEDMAVVFQIMDDDHSGKVDYKEFVQHIYKMKTADEQTLLNFIRHYVMDILRVLRQEGMGVAATRSERGSVSRGISHMGTDSKAPSYGAVASTRSESKEERGADTTVVQASETSVVTAAMNGNQLDELRKLCDTILGRVDNELLTIIGEVSNKCDLQASEIDAMRRSFDSATDYRSNMVSKLLAAPDGADRTGATFQVIERKHDGSTGSTDDARNFLSWCTTDKQQVLRRQVPSPPEFPKR